MTLTGIYESIYYNFTDGFLKVSNLDKILLISSEKIINWGLQIVDKTTNIFVDDFSDYNNYNIIIFMNKPKNEQNILPTRNTPENLHKMTFFTILRENNISFMFSFGDDNYTLPSIGMFHISKNISKINLLMIPDENIFLNECDDFAFNLYRKWCENSNLLTQVVNTQVVNTQVVNTQVVNTQVVNIQNKNGLTMIPRNVSCSIYVLHGKQCSGKETYARLHGMYVISLPLQHTLREIERICNSQYNERFVNIAVTSLINDNERSYVKDIAKKFKREYKEIEFKISREFNVALCMLKLAKSAHNYKSIPWPNCARWKFANSPKTPEKIITDDYLSAFITASPFTQYVIDNIDILYEYTPFYRILENPDNS